MTTDYEPDHPLYGRDAEWIARLAEDKAEYTVKNAVESSTWELALAHEYKRLKAGAATLRQAEELYRKGINSRDIRIAELKSTHPPEDWLTHAIEAAGAPEGSDWAGLLERIGELESGYRNGLEFVVNVRKLRERAEAAESKTESLRDLCLLRTDERDSVMIERGTLKAKLESDQKLATHAIDGLQSVVGSLTAQRDRALMERDMYGLEVSRLNATPTPTPLTQIAADVAKIAATLMEMKVNG